MRSRTFRRGTTPSVMKRLESVILELEAARTRATQEFAAQVNMPVSAFLEHFSVVMQGSLAQGANVSFRVEPREG